MEKQNEQKHVLIAVPTVDSQVTTGIAEMFGIAQKLNYKDDYPWSFSTTTCQGVKGYDAARNTIAKKFFELDADYLWMFDQDMQPPGNTFQLLDTEGDIVAPLLPTLKIHTDLTTRAVKFELPFCACVYDDLGRISSRRGVDVSGGGILDVDGVGFGSVLIKRKLLEDRRLWHDPAWIRPDNRKCVLKTDDPPPIFRYNRKPNGACDIGEDFSFCRRARLLGYSVKLDTRIVMGHIKHNVDLGQLFDLKAVIDGLFNAREGI